MDREQEFRNKSAMVVWQIEKDLGDFIKANAINKNLEYLSSHVSKLQNENVPSSIIKLVEETYLDEIFSLSMEISKGTSTYDKLKKLKELCSISTLFLIRNAIAHPNKPFPENYWYKVCSIATDPIIEILNLPNIYNSFRGAEAGQIVMPPDEWMSQPVWCIPNDLPKQFEHTITGFVGRKNDINNILKCIENKRLSLIAITGPGGLGKTAITLEILKDISNDPKYMNDFDAISFISMKTEKLTTEGLKNIPAVDTLESLKEKIVYNINFLFNDSSSYEELIKKYDNKNILLFIDNLETLLRDNQESFCNLVNEFPEKWRILVTSRIAVDSAASYPLKDMTDLDAIKLARFYADRRNVGNYVNNYEKTVSILKNNPLAIRLCMDSLQFGKDIDTILSNVSSEINSFSYKNLIEVLSEHSIGMLEALFLQNELSREEIAGILETSIDNISEAVQQLKRTSLILLKNNDTGEKFYLNDSVRDYLRFSQRNINVREKMLYKLNQNKIIMSEIKRKQIDQNVSQNSIWYISSDIPSELQRMVQSVKKIRKQEEKGPLLKSLQEFTTKQDIYSKHMIYWNIRSFLAGKIGDIQSVAICTERLLSFGKDSFCANYSSCLNNLYTLHNYSEAQRIAELLINNIEKYSINDYEKKDLYAAYMRSLIYLKKNEDILNYTKKWSTEGVLRSTLGASRALAYKRIYEDSYNFEDKINNITKSIKIISDVYQVGGADKFVNSVIKEIYKVIIELIEDNHIVDNDILKLFLNFVFETSEILYPEGIDSYTNKLLSDVKCDENPFICNLVYDEEFDISEILNNDEYKKVEVYHIPDKYNTFPLYIFAKDHMEKQYFLRSDCCKNLDWNGWKKVKIGSFFYIKPCIVNEDCSKAAETSEIYIYKY